MNIKSLMMKFYIKCKERKFSDGVHQLKYIVRRKRNAPLVVVFSAFAGGEGGTPSYNYIRTLMPIKKAALLFILDDLIDDVNTGSYYLGTNGDFWGIDAVIRLISDQQKKLGADSLIMVGSSKGATAAIMFGLKMNANLVIAGAPQYYIGSYLDCNAHRHLLPHLLGATFTQSDIDKLDQILPRLVSDCANMHHTQFALHYSTKEHTYEEHICALVRDLKNYGYDLTEDIEDYCEHGDVRKFFPRFLTTTLRRSLSSK